MPKKAIFKKKQIHNKAYELFEKYGLDEITARNLAKALDASPAPIYNCYTSMNELKEELIERAKKKYLEYLGKHATGVVFIDIAMGICTFAREEKQLFRSIFLKDYSYEGIIKQFKGLVESEMEKDIRFKNVNKQEKDKIFLDCWIYAHGMATLIATNYLENITDEEILERLKEAPEVIFNTRLSKAGAI